MANLEVDVEQVKRLVELVETYSLESLAVEEGDLAITVKGRSPAPAPPAPGPVVVSAPHAEIAHEAEEEHVHEEAPASPAEQHEGNVVDIVATLVGVFYRAPAPDAPPFVDVGDVIEVGSEVGLIEAMKVFSPIPSDVAGEVVAIPAVNGKLVQAGDVLVRVKVSEES